MPIDIAGEFREKTAKEVENASKNDLLEFYRENVKRGKRLIFEYSEGELPPMILETGDVYGGREVKLLE